MKKGADGAPVHPISEDRIGVYIDTRQLVIATATGFHTIDLQFNTGLEDEIATLTSGLNSIRFSRSANTSDVSGETVEGLIGMPVDTHIKEDTGYRRMRERLAEAYRVSAERRRHHAYRVANEVLSYGSDITVNDYAFRAAGMRISGKRRKAGRSIQSNAPAKILEIIDKKLLAAGKSPMKRVRISVDHSIDDFRQHYAEILRDTS